MGTFSSQPLNEFQNFYHSVNPIANLVIFFILVLCGLVLQLRGKAPKMSSMREFVNLANTRGGNIVVLSVFSIWFFQSSMRLFYYAFDEVAEKRLTVDNALIMMALQFVTGAAFGGAFGAMLKTMTGSDGQSRATDLDGEKSKSITTISRVVASDEPQPPETAQRTS